MEDKLFARVKNDYFAEIEQAQKPVDEAMRERDETIRQARLVLEEELDRICCENGNVPVWELWKKGNRNGYSNKKFIKDFTMDKEKAVRYSQKRCMNADHWIEEVKLRNLKADQVKRLLGVEMR